MERPLVNGGFAKETERDPICLLILGSKSDTGRERDLSADDCMPPKKTQINIEQMHRATLAARAAARFAIKFRHHSVG